MGTRYAFRTRRPVRWLGLLALLIVLPLPDAAATDYYVSATGDDAASGTSPADAWCTIARVNAATFAPGDNILLRRGDLWREELQIECSGAAGDPITFRAYGLGPDPILSGADLVVNWAPYPELDHLYRTICDWEVRRVFEEDTPLTRVTWEGSIELTYPQMSPGSWTVDPGTQLLYVWATDGADPDTHSMEVSRRHSCIWSQWSDTHYITITALHLEKADGAGDRAGIHTGGGHHWRIRSCRIRRNGSRGISIDADHTTVEFCDISDNDYGITCWSAHNVAILDCSFRDNNYSVDSDAIQMGGAEEFLIAGNYIAGSNNGECSDGVKMDGGSQGVIYGNLFENNGNAAITIASGAREYHISYNVILSTAQWSGIAIADISGFGEIYNNTIYNAGSAGIRIFETHPDGLEIKNNIVLATDGWNYALRTQPGVDVSPITLDHNCYYKESPTEGPLIHWDGSDYRVTEFGDYQEASGQDGRGMAVDPLLEDTAGGDLRLTQESPCLNAGTDVGLTHDFDGNPVSIPPEIGAFEFFDVSGPNPPAEGGAGRRSVLLLVQNHPNPFHASTWIQFDPGQPGPLRLEIYDSAGRLVRVLIDAVRPAGLAGITWNGCDTRGERLPCGRYYSRLVAGGASLTRPMLLLR